MLCGKINQAHYYCDNGNRVKSSELLNELAEMGVEDNDEMTEIKAKI